ncbi:HD domain-containing phosphohydrolase [Kineococcus sp. GCM10028916]|uniref:HD-GYP domain-containing protein n=1 Tax=Kineococcus sp. GCM10028916 TaxID=3273394 RepID=UPI0036391AFB
MRTGPTQNYGEAAGRTWRPRPVLARSVRAVAVLGPLVFALVVGAAAARWAPAERLRLNAAVWLVLVVALSSAVMVVANRWLRRLLPLASMLRLSLVLPDHVPNRFAVARRRWSPEKLAGSGGAEHGSAQQLLALISALAAHDASTRAHGERVQAYAALIGRELGLSGEDVDRLSWVALLHDVGKIHVPTEVINAKGRPSEEGWARLQSHPAHGGELVEPLRSWLGPWVDGVVQHHERWDGQGYPRGLAGADISLAARVIAVADTYDVITSARSYKKPMSAEQARAEITRCAGDQFDPDVVRAFLSVGLGRLRIVAGPATLLAALPWMGSIPAQAVSTASAAAQTAGGQVATVLLATGIGVSSSVTATHAVADVLPTSAATSAPTSTPVATPTKTPHPATAHEGTAHPTSGQRSSTSSGPVDLPVLEPVPTSSPTSSPAEAGSPTNSTSPTSPVDTPEAGPTSVATSSAPGEPDTAVRPERTTSTENGPIAPAPAKPAPAKPAPAKPAPAKPAPAKPAPAKPAPAPAKPAPEPAPAKPAPAKPAPAKPAPAKPASPEPGPEKAPPAKPAERSPLQPAAGRAGSAETAPTRAAPPEPAPAQPAPERPRS